MSDNGAPHLSHQHFLNTADLPQDELLNLIDYALRIKRGAAQPRLDGKVLAALFFNPSLRTRTSFAAAMFRMGGLMLDLSVGGGSMWSMAFEDGQVMDGLAAEHIKEAAPVLSRYCDAIAIRSSELITNAAESVEVPDWDTLKTDAVLNGFAAHAEVPVISMESNVYHPCQGLGDALTITEKLKQPQGRKYVLTWAYHPKALPMATPHSQLLAACDLGMDVVVAHPPEWALDEDVMAQANARAVAAGGSLSVSHDQTAAVKDAAIVCAKSWGAKSFYGDWTTEAELRQTYKDWQVTEDLMAHSDDGLFMHCLPVRRNIVVADEVLDGPRSIVIDQAENRLWAQMAILAALMSDK